MKKRNAILLGIGFLLMVVAYVAWCWRPYYQRAPFTYHSDVPPEAVAVVEKWRKDDPTWKPWPFDPTLALLMLCHPGHPFMWKIDVGFGKNHERVTVNVQGDPFTAGTFIKEGSGWQLVR